MNDMQTPELDYIEWDGHPDVLVSDDELRRLIAEDWERTLGR